jgi:hypothetical protein
MIKGAFPAGAYAVISVGNQEVARILLDAGPQLFDFHSAIGPVVVERKNGQVRMAKTSCPNKICRKMGWIDTSGGIIVCAPGKVMIRITGEKENDLDALTR